jgi:adenylate cyclase
MLPLRGSSAVAEQSVERRLAAILVADVAGYSRLMGVDEVGTLRTLKAHRKELFDPVLTAHHGRIVKTTGDGVLVEFPSAVDAVASAVAIQRGMIARNAEIPQDRRIELRIGINVGDVIIDGDDIQGDGVNVAARLEALAEPSGLCISGTAYEQVRDKLPFAFADRGEQTVKNISRPVRVYALGADAMAALSDMPASMEGAGAPPRRLRDLRSILQAAAGTAAVIVLAAGMWLAVRPAKGPEMSATATHLSIVVLPFTNLSNDPSQDYFADGVTDNLTTDLSRIRDSFVIARGTAFTYKGKSIDAKEIGKELGVRYVLEGSVQRDQNRVRVNAQLIDAESGALLWADRFEEDVADLFKLQDHVVARLANTLGNELVKAEAQESSRSKNPDIIDLDMRGQALLQQFPMTKDNNNAAREWFEQALKINPNDADGLAGDAFTYALEFGYGWTDPKTDYDAKILPQLDRAIALAPDNLWAYYAKSNYLNNSQRPNEALGAADAGLAINPNSALLYGARSPAELYLGRFEQAKSDAQQAMRLSPRDPRIGLWHWLLGVAEFSEGHYDASIDEYHEALDAGQRTYFTYSTLAAALALEGKMEEAKTALAEARRLNPNLTMKWLISHASNVPPVFEGLRKAGLPEE